MKKKLISAILVLVMLLAMLPVGASATEVLTEEETADLFTHFGFASLQTSRNSRYFAPGEQTPDRSVYWFVFMADELDQYLNNETWYFELTYEQYMAIVDQYFVNHSDMKAYLTECEYYDAETGLVRFYSGGFGDAWSWVVLSTHQSDDIYKIQGLFLNQPVEDTTGLTENIDYYVDTFEIDGEVYTRTMYIDTVLELTMQDTDEGWKILGFEQGDYYIIEQDGDATLYAMDSETKTVSGIYSRVRLFETCTTFMSQGKNLKDALATFESNDDLWYVSDEGFTWEAATPEGYVLSEVICNTPAGSAVCGTQGTVEPGTGAVELWATPDAVIDVDARHASVEVLQGLKEYGDKYLYSITGAVELKVTADAGYEVVEVSMGNVQGQYLESTGTYVIYPNFEPATLTVKTQLKFTDVPEGAYYNAPVQWAVENGITNGLTETTFGPTESCNRAQVVTFLWRAAGCPEPTSTEHPFVDISEKAFYYKAMLWAVENGITTGTDATHFSPNAVCNRATVVTFIWRAKGKPAPASTDNPFTDVNTGSWYGNAVLWAVENNITNGLSNTTFGPTTNCNRAQVVTFLYRAYAE